MFRGCMKRVDVCERTVPMKGRKVSAGGRTMAMVFFFFCPLDLMI